MNQTDVPVLHLIANSKSGRGAGAALADLAAKLCAEQGTRLVPYPINEPAELDDQADRAVAAALRDGGVVVAAGGDGTIRAVAAKAMGKAVRFAVVPCGTFNFFARTHRIPEDLDGAVRLALTGAARPVRLGDANGEIFLINASLGLYAKAVQERDQRTDRWGRNRFVVILSTIVSFLARHRHLNVELLTGKAQQELRTSMIFIGNNALQLRNLSMNVARCMQRDLLAVVTFKPIGKWEALRILIRGIGKTLDREESLDSFCVDSLTIKSRRRRLTVALDGEIFHMNSPIRIRALPRVLNLVLPPAEPTATPEPRS